MSKQTSPPPIFFIDRALGQRLVAKALRKAGAQVEVHQDHFAPDSPDTEWLPEVSQRGWIVLTKDARIGVNLVEQIAVAQSGARVFILSLKEGATGTEMAAVLVQAMTSMTRLITSQPEPFLAKVYAFGKVRMWKDHRKLAKVLREMLDESDNEA